MKNGKRGRDRRQKKQTASNTSLETSTSALDDSAEAEQLQKKKKTGEKQTVSTPLSRSILSHFSPIPSRAKIDMNPEADKTTVIEEEFPCDPPPVVIEKDPAPDVGNSTFSVVTNQDLMEKLCSNGSHIEKLTTVVEELRADRKSVV